MILNLKLNNILCFKDFEINFSYPIKLKKTLIKNEFIEEIPSFRYKKVNIFIGSNASGKTLLMTSIWKILLFLRTKEKNSLMEIVNKKEKYSDIIIDLVEKEDVYYLYRFKIRIINNDNIDLSKIEVAYNKLIIKNNDSYEAMMKKLDLLDYNYLDYVTSLKDYQMISGWNAILPATDKHFTKIKVFKDLKDKDKEYLNIVNAILKTLDPAINEVTRSKEVDDMLLIQYDDYVVTVRNDMQISEIEKLSSGTKYGINISNIVYSIKNKINGIYIIDEQFAYVDSDIEKNILALIIDLLGDNEQLFFTTHNDNIYDLRYPFHSFNFMKKDKIDNKIYVYNASLLENRNNVSPKSLIDNDAFSTSPDLKFLDTIGG